MLWAVLSLPLAAVRAPLEARPPMIAHCGRRAAITSALQLALATLAPAASSAGDTFDRLAAEAQRAFQPDATEMAAEIARMEAELRALTLQRDLQQQQMELARLTALLDEAEEPRITEVAEVEEGDSAGEQEHDAANVD